MGRVKAYVAVEIIRQGDLVFIHDGYARKWRPGDGKPEEIEVERPTKPFAIEQPKGDPAA